MRKACLMLLLLAGLPCAAAEDFKVIKLEQDVRRLEQQVRELSRQVVELQRGAARPGEPAPTTTRPEPATDSSRWLDAENWDRIQPGMTELQVISILGPPTSLRAADDAGSQTMFYALEIGSSGFLGGQVKLGDGRVTEVERPKLK